MIPTRPPLDYSPYRFINPSPTAEERYVPTTLQKIKDFMASPIGQGLIGVGLGIGMTLIYPPLTGKIIKMLGVSSPCNPFNSLGLGVKLLITSLVCIEGPVLEEKIFRGTLQEILTDTFEAFYTNRWFSNSAANVAARVTSVFFTSITFGLTHFSNAILFWCNPVLFLPQVVAATIMGLALGCAKEFSGDLVMPSIMHITNNTIAHAYSIWLSL